MTTSKTASQKYTFRDILRALGRRKTLAMFALGFAAGLPYVLITGTLLAWFTQENIPIKTIGIFSWITIIYSFKFLWAPAVDRMQAPRLFGMRQRRAGILVMQSVIIAALAFISFASPTSQLELIALAAIICTVASTCQDVLIDAWRIEVADEETSIDLLSSVYQIGYRLAAILGGAGALIIAHRIGWNNTFIALAVLMAVAVTGVFIAQNSPTLRKSNDLEGDVPPGWIRNVVIFTVLILWAWAFSALFGFMAHALQSPETANARNFTRETGPLIIVATIILPVIAAAFLLRPFSAKSETPLPNKWPAQPALDIMYGSVLAPMMDLIKRLRWSALLVLFLVLSYRFVDLVWGGLAYPFYLGANFGALGHSLDEVAIASKLFGTLMTFLGITIGGLSIIKFGRMPCLVIGAILAAATNLLFADLALGGEATHAFLSTTRLYAVFGAFQPLAEFLGLDVTIGDKLSRLMAVIAAENLAVGFASAAIVVYLSSIANPKFAALQYALSLIHI